MRITNNIITGNTKANINGNKISVDKYNTQMTTQKKISKASDDPVIAVRSLRLGTSLSHLDQYASNIKDANSWLDVTETALTNMKSLLTDIRTQCVNGSTDTLNANDRKTILTTLSQLADQVYSEGNTDYAGRTIFTGYRTNNNLTFDKDTTDTTYQITQPFDYKQLTEQRYYSGSVKVPAEVTDATEDCPTEISEESYMRLRTAYDSITSMDGFSITTGEGAAATTTNYTFTTNADGTTTVSPAGTVKVYETTAAWEQDNLDANGQPKKVLGDNEIAIIKDTGEIVFGADISKQLISDKASFSVSYTKTGFNSGELRPEYYYDCTDITDVANPIHYNMDEADSSTDEKLVQEIRYTISNATDLVVNTQARDVFDSSIGRDVKEMINIVQNAIDAHTKVDNITAMMKQTEYVGDEKMQAKLQTYLDAAQKEADYADDHLQKTYGQYITNFDNYLTQVNIGITNVGSAQTRLAMTQTRVENQTNTVEELKSNNEDRDISDIMIDYYASYYAYQASLTSAGKLNQQTLLDYI